MQIVNFLLNKEIGAKSLLFDIIFISSIVIIYVFFFRQVRLAVGRKMGYYVVRT